MMSKSTEVIPNDAWKLLAPRFSDQRRQRMIDVVAARSRRLRLVIEDIHEPHNISACLRSAEAYGLVDVDVITNKERYRVSTAAKGVQQWLNIHRHVSVDQCAPLIKAQGYRIAAAYPNPDAVALDQVPTDQPLALVFGNEHRGLSEKWRPWIDVAFTVPMYGFVESLNISVSCAISLSQLRPKMAQQHPDDFYLSSEEQKLLLNLWSCRQVRSFAQELEHLRRRNSV